MSSTSGVGAMIGLHSGEVLGYDSRKKKCRTCESAFSRGVEPLPHNCRYNWSKSLKATEPDVTVALAKELLASGMELGALLADDDAATIKKNPGRSRQQH